MRSFVFLAALLAGATVAAPARSGPIFTFGGVDPTKLTFQPVDTSASVVPIAQPQTRSSVGFKLINLLPRISFPGAKPVVGQSQFPTPADMPGASYLKAFRFQQLGPAQ